MAKYPYIVNKNGKWYPAGSEVPEDAENLKKNKEETLDLTKEEQVKKYTKTEIFRMSNADLQTLAKQQGIKDAEEKTGSELKKLLVQHFGL